jgi:hypothetical protein
VGVQATAARMSQETVAAQDMLTRFAQWQGRAPESVSADTTYGNGEFLQWLSDRNITPYMRARDSIHRKHSPFASPERFTYEPEKIVTSVPQASHLTMVVGSIGTAPTATLGRANPVARARKDRHDRCCFPESHHPPAGTSLAMRKEIREDARVRPCRAVTEESGSLVRGTQESDRTASLKFVREQFFLAAAQNIKRLLRFLNQPTIEAAP